MRAKGPAHSSRLFDGSKILVESVLDNSLTLN